MNHPCYEPELTVLVGQPPNKKIHMPEPEQAASTIRVHTRCSSLQIAL